MAITSWPALRSLLRRTFKNYYYLHLAFFLVVALVGGGILSGIEGLAYADGLFTATSAICVTGLSVADTSTMKVGSQITIFVLLMVGSTVLFSVVPVLGRMFFYRRFLSKHADAEPQVQLEYKVLQKLSWLVPLYYAGNILFVFLVLGVFTSAHATTREDITSRGQSTWWLSAFLATSSFCNAGFSLFADSVVQFQRSPFVLLVLSYSILAGNTAFPLFLWLLVSFRVKVLGRCVASDTDAYGYLLRYPRRCYTHLFPPKITLWLLMALLVLNLFQFAFSCGFNWNRETLNFLPAGDRIVNSLFQSISTRTAGFNSIDLTNENPGVLVLTLVMMYIGSYPVVLFLRSSNEDVWEAEAEPRQVVASSLRAQARNLIFRDAAFVFLSYFVICLIETSNIDQDPVVFSLFRILFEVMSAYGTVGLSLAPPGAVVSLSGYFHTASKVLVCAVMMLGRHRGLPQALDAAIVFKRASRVESRLKERRSLSLDLAPRAEVQDP